MILLFIIIFNILLVALLNKKAHKEVFTINITDDNIYYLLNDDIYLTLKKEKNIYLNNKQVFVALKNYAFELSKICSKLVIIDKFNTISKEEVEKIICI